MSDTTKGFMGTLRQMEELRRMSETTPQNYVTEVHTQWSGVMAKDRTVDASNVDPRLQRFMQVFGPIHVGLFGFPLVVTSGRDGAHAEGSKHPQGKAIDLRLFYLRDRAEPVFLLIVRELCDQFMLNYFDETNLPGNPHVHVETND